MDEEEKDPPLQAATTKSAPLEQGVRLSRSMIWTLQRSFYERHGVEAWRSEGIPFHITSNTYIAQAYARVVLGWLRDNAPFDPGEPVTLVELGAGHGRFGYLFLKKLLRLQQASPSRDVKDVRLQYVMTDLAERNVELWRGNPRLRPFLDSGLLDLACFDAARDTELRLAVSGRVLVPGAVRNPLVMIANYLFDSLPQDAFWIEDGRLYESLVTVTPRRKETDPGDPNNPDLLSRVDLSFHYNPAAPGYYGDPDLDALLDDSVQRLPATAFLFPVTALQCIRVFRELSADRLLLLAADKGYHRDDELVLGHGVPSITRHGRGSFSMMVDYRFLGESFRRAGGEALQPRHRHESLLVSAFLLGDPPGHLETRQAYQAAVEDFGPDDFFTLAPALDLSRDPLSLEQALAYLRLSAWDHRLLWRQIPFYKSRCAELAEARKQDLCDAARQVWDCYFPLGEEEEDLGFALGVLFLEMKLYREALDFFGESTRLYGLEPGTAYNMGLCHYGLREMEAAARCVQQALELDPELDSARLLRIRLQ
jgi:tetratricopeptide (TPR) repeat protein